MIRVIELFGGIGAPAKALKKAGIEHTVVDYVEQDKHAVASYNAINGTNFTTQDVTKWDKDIKCDYLHASTPCQAFSVAGKQLGANDHRGASLWEATINIIKRTEPKMITLENVKGLLQSKHQELLEWYLNELNQLGYHTEYAVLNSKYYGIPQNRERVFFVSLHSSIINAGGKIQWPLPHSKIPTLKEILEEDVKWEIATGGFINNDKIYFENKLSQYNGKTVEVSIDKLNNQKPGEINRVGKLKQATFVELNKSLDITHDSYDIAFNSNKHYIGTQGIAPTHAAKEYCTFQNKIIEQVDLSKPLKDVAFSNKSTLYGTQGVNGCIGVLDSESQKVIELDDIAFNQDKNFIGVDGIVSTLTTLSPDFKAKILNTQLRYRKLTALECWRLMGFDDEDYYKATQVCSTSQLCKQAGNSIVVNVMSEMFKVLIYNLTFINKLIS